MTGRSRLSPVAGRWLFIRVTARVGKRIRPSIAAHLPRNLQYVRIMTEMNEPS